MHGSWQRPVLTLLASLALATSGAVALAPPARAADTDVKINEINHIGTDFVELVNTGSAPVDITGFKILDSDNTHTPFSIPSTTLNPGVRITFENFGFGLGDGDSVTLFAADGTTVLDSFTWAAPGAATTSWSRCPDSTGAFAISAAVSKGTPNVCSAGAVVKINEIESLGGTPGDWVELKNTDTTSVDVSGFQIKDSGDANVHTIPNTPTTIAAGGYLVIEESELGFSLDDADSVRLFATDGTTVLDSYSWTFPAATTTYGRCADGTGNITKTKAPTKGAVNSCIVADAWPGGSAVSTADTTDFFGENMSGLAYEGNVAGTPGTLWAVKNNVGTLYRLVRSGSTWVTDGGDWAAGKVLHFPNGTGNIDAEGVAFTDAGAAGGAYVAVERDNSAGGVSRPSILRFDPGTAGTALNATNEWNLTADLPGLGANLGPEAIAWVPDTYLTDRGFRTSGGAVYNPADYPNHGSGLFLVGVENTGNVYAYAVNHSDNTFTRIASFDSGFPAVMELHWEQETQKLWAVCDDTCQGRTAGFGVETAAGANQGTFVPVKYYERPSAMGNLNNEGFTTTPRSECVGGVKPVFWADDGETGGHALRVGTLTCTEFPTPTISATLAAAGGKSAAGWYRAPVTVSFTCTLSGAVLAAGCPAPVTLSNSGANQSVSRSVTTSDGKSATATVTDVDIDLDAPSVAIGGVKAGKTYKKKQKPTCLGYDGLSGLASCTVTQEKKKGRKHTRYVVTATATDLAGNVSATTLTYKVKKPQKK